MAARILAEIGIQLALQIGEGLGHVGTQIRHGLGVIPSTGGSLRLAVATTARALSQQISTCLLNGSMSTISRSP